MNEKQFITKVIESYHTAREPLFSNPKIRRGRSHSVASKIEDLFALYLVNKIKSDQIYIDQPISVVGSKAQIYPDIVIVKNKKITALCDVKMDLGWKRNELYNFCKRHASLLKKIRGIKCKIRDGQTKEDIYYQIDKKACLNIVIISDQNINKTLLAKHIKKIEPFKNVVRVIILTSGEHPNTYRISTSDLLKKLVINIQSFTILIKALS